MNNKDEILKKSRNENKGKDLFEKEIEVKAGIWGACAAAVVVAIFITVQIIVGSGMNYGLLAVAFSISAGRFVFRAIHMKQRNDIVFSVIHTIATLSFSIAHIFGMIASSAIL